MKVYLMVCNILCHMLCYISYCMKHSTHLYFILDETFHTKCLLILQFFEVQKFNFLKFKKLEFRFVFCCAAPPPPLQLPESPSPAANPACTSCGLHGSQRLGR